MVAYGSSYSQPQTFSARNINGVAAAGFVDGGSIAAPWATLALAVPVDDRLLGRHCNCHRIRLRRLELHVMA